MSLAPDISKNVAFYRVPVGKNVAVTVDTQLIKDPALNPDESTIWMFNIRARFAF